MKTVAVMALAGVLLAGSAIAQETSGYPDMRGQWKGTNEGVVLGSGMYHREGGKAAEPRTMNKEFTIDIKGQDGRRFWGEIVSKDDTGPLLGVIASDKQTIYYVDNTGGHVTGKLTGPGRFEICYLRPSKEIMVAACNLFVKQ